MLLSMEPVTHMLTGACLSRACGFPRHARYATLACVIAAELPDADFAYRLGGPLVYFQHHRGWTHALWSLPLQAIFVVGLMFLWQRLRRQFKRRRSHGEPVPTRWPLLGLMALAALLSHILLDWTNNYGIRPFAPFNPRWYSADLVFIVEPVLLLLLSAALILPLLLSLTDSEIGVRRSRSGGQALAIAALAATGALWLWRYDQHTTAIRTALRQEYTGGEPIRIAAEPYPINPYRWHVIVENGSGFQTGTVDNRIAGIFETSRQQVFAKPPTTLATLAAKHSWLGHVYLDWSQFPLTEETGSVAEIHPELDLLPTERSLRVVRFRDLRFMYDTLGLNGSTDAPLGGEAWIDEARRAVHLSFGGATQHPPLTGPGK